MHTMNNMRSYGLALLAPILSATAGCAGFIPDNNVGSFSTSSPANATNVAFSVHVNEQIGNVAVCAALTNVNHGLYLQALYHVAQKGLTASKAQGLITEFTNPTMVGSDLDLSYAPWVEMAYFLPTNQSLTDSTVIFAVVGSQDHRWGGYTTSLGSDLRPVNFKEHITLFNEMNSLANKKTRTPREIRQLQSIQGYLGHVAANGDIASHNLAISRVDLGQVCGDNNEPTQAESFDKWRVVYQYEGNTSGGNAVTSTILDRATVSITYVASTAAQLFGRTGGKSFYSGG